MRTLSLVAKIVVMGSQLDQLRVSFRNHRPDLSLMSIITDTDFLDDMDPNSISRQSVRATVQGPTELLLEFSGHTRDAL